jgi:serine/threonine protein kinase
MGVAMTETTRLIVTELMHGASLDILVHKKVRKTRLFHNVISFSKKIELLMDVIKGMLYLHGLNPPIVHRDLKPSVSAMIVN